MILYRASVSLTARVGARRTRVRSVLPRVEVGVDEAFDEAIDEAIDEGVEEDEDIKLATRF